MRLSCGMKWEGLGFHLLQVYNQSETAGARYSGLDTTLAWASDSRSIHGLGHVEEHGT